MDFNVGFEEHGVEITHHFAPHLYAKETRIPAGKILSQHVHPFDHLSILAQGVVLLEVDGEAQQVTGPAALTIAAGKAHRVTAETPVVWFCIHSTEVTDPAEIDEALV